MLRLERSEIIFIQLIVISFQKYVTIVNFFLNSIKIINDCFFNLKKTLAEVPQNILFPSFTITIIYWLSNLNPNYDVYFIITSIIVMASNAAVGFG